MKKKVIGIGGIFFKSQDPEKSRNWYAEHLGLNTNQYGATFEFRNSERPEEKNYALWSPFDKSTEYFLPSKKDFMINFRVENLESLVDELRTSGVTIIDKIETFEYGKFVHILDPDGVAIELWEADNEFYEKMVAETVTK